jgi:hypothetical protein
MPRRIGWVVLGLSAAVPACTSFEAVDLRPYLEKQDIPVTQGPAPADSESVGIMAVQDTGFYLLGVAPFVPVSLDACVRELVREAKRLGGEGIAEVEIVYAPASLLNFTVILLPDWFATVKLTGSAWRKRRGRSTDPTRIPGR